MLFRSTLEIVPFVAVKSEAVTVVVLRTSFAVSAKRTGVPVDGSRWVEAWARLTTGAVVSYVTELSVEVEARLPLPAGSVTWPAAIERTTVPSAELFASETTTE